MLQANKKRLRERTMKALPDYITKPQRSKPGWRDALSMVGGALMDADGTMGYGNMQNAMTRIQQRIRLQDEEKQAELDRKRRQIILDGMKLSPQQRALMELGSEDRSSLYSMTRDAKLDARNESRYADSRGDRADDVAHRNRVHDHNVMADERNFNRGVFESDRSHGLAEANAAAKRAESLGPDVKGESALRKEFFGQNKGFQEVQRAYDRIVSTDATNAAGQMSLIFQYMKMMDPGSTVREGEFANAQNTTGIPGAVLNAYNRARAGEFLNETQVAEFERQAAKLYDAAANDFERSFEQYRSTAGDYQFDPGRTIPDLRNPSYMQPEPSAPQFPGAPVIGTVDDGHEYVGGDPANPSSWRPVG